MGTIRWHASVIWCVVVIQVVGVWSTLQHLLENVLLLWSPFGFGSLQVPLPATPRENTKVALVTGANRGIGLAITELLVRSGVRTLLLCRSRRAAQAAVDAVFHEPALRARCTIVQVDLSSFASVRKAASEVILTLMRMGTRLDYVVGNAGIMDPPTFKTGRDGYELQMEVNTLSHALLVHLLLKAGVVHSSPASRILCVSSFAHHGFTYMSDSDDGLFTTEPAEYHPKLAYARSKWYQILLMQALQERIEKTYGTKACCMTVNPGAVYTDMAKDYCKGEFPQAVRWISDPALESLMPLALRRASTAAWLVLAVLTGSDTGVDGSYLYMGPTGRIRRRVYGTFRSKIRWEDVLEKIA